MGELSWNHPASVCVQQLGGGMALYKCTFCLSQDGHTLLTGNDGRLNNAALSQDARHRVESMGGRTIGPMAWVGWRHWSTCACCTVLYNFHGGCANAFFNNGHALWALGGAHLEPHLEPKATRRPTHVLVDDSAQLSWHA